MIRNRLVILAAAQIFLGAMLAPAHAQVVPASRADLQQSFAPIVQRTAPAVVNVYSSVTVRRTNCPYTNTIDQMMYCRNAQVKNEKVDNSLGSGVIVRADGVIVTNNHVVENGQEFRVALTDRREFAATVMMADPRTDLAVLKIDTKGEKLPVLEFTDTRGTMIGDIVLAIGNPFGVGQTVTSGIVSALARSDVGVSDIASFIQTDASINPGNSGGALVDMAGRLVGINSIIFSKGGGSNGIGFAIPSEMVKRVVDVAVNGGTLVRPWLGAKGDAVTSKTAPTVGLDRPKGVLISEVYPGSPAQKASIQQGDVILAIDGREVYDEKNMKFVAATRGVGETIPVDIWRKGKQVRVNLLLASPPGATSAEIKVVEGYNPFAGAEVLEVTPALAEQYNADMFRTGVVVNRIVRRDYALRYVQPGDFIRELNGVRINTVKDLDATLKKIEASKQQVWRIALERNGQRVERTVNG